jgi:hypothetical protein
VNAETRRAQHEAGNRRAAELILREPEKYGGEESLPVTWARKVLRKGTEGADHKEQLHNREGC